jgi:hypothetical protein
LRRIKFGKQDTIQKLDLVGKNSYQGHLRVLLQSWEEKGLETVLKFSDKIESGKRATREEVGI